MATATTSLTDIWVNVTSTLSLVATNQYLFQNVGSQVIYLNESSTEPAANAKGYYLIGGLAGVVFTQSADPLWARASDTSGLLNSNLSVAGA